MPVDKVEIVNSACGLVTASQQIAVRACCLVVALANSGDHSLDWDTGTKITLSTIVTRFSISSDLPVHYLEAVVGNRSADIDSFGRGAFADCHCRPLTYWYVLCTREQDVVRNEV